MTETISKSEAELIATKAAKQAVNEALEALGVDVKNAPAMQRDMAHLRKDRLLRDRVSAAISAGLLKLAFLGLAGIAAVGSYFQFKH